MTYTEGVFLLEVYPNGGKLSRRAWIEGNDDPSAWVEMQPAHDTGTPKPHIIHAEDHKHIPYNSTFAGEDDDWIFITTEEMLPLIVAEINDIDFKFSKYEVWYSDGGFWHTIILPKDTTMTSRYNDLFRDVMRSIVSLFNRASDLGLEMTIKTDDGHSICFVCVEKWTGRNLDFRTGEHIPIDKGYLIYEDKPNGEVRITPKPEDFDYQNRYKLSNRLKDVHPSYDQG